MPRICERVWFFPASNDQIEDVGPLAAIVTGSTVDGLNLAVYSESGQHAGGRTGVPFIANETIAALPHGYNFERPYCRYPPEIETDNAANALAEYASG